MITFKQIAVIAAAALASLGGSESAAIKSTNAELNQGGPADAVNAIHGDWLLRCVENRAGPPCEIVQAATMNETGEQVMQFAIAHAGDRDAFGILITLPLGIQIQGGVLLRINETTDIADYKITRCEQQGCLIERVVSADDLDLFHKSKKGVVAVLDRTGKPMVVPVSFNGFTKALDEMRRKNMEWAKNPHPRKDS